MSWISSDDAAFSRAQRLSVSGSLKRQRGARRLLDWHQVKLSHVLVALFLSFGMLLLRIVKSFLMLSLALHSIFVLLRRLLKVLITSVYKLTCILLLDYFAE